VIHAQSVMLCCRMSKVEGLNVEGRGFQYLGNPCVITFAIFAPFRGQSTPIRVYVLLSINFLFFLHDFQHPLRSRHKEL
jgi:hypothetical protein